MVGGAGDEDVVGVLALKCVLTGTADQDISTIAAEEVVVPVTADSDVVVSTSTGAGSDTVTV